MRKFRYPQLRQSLVGSWCPSLGVTGNLLIDQSGRGNHGILTNMDPGTDWVPSQGKLALDFDRVNDFTLVSSTFGVKSFPYAFGCWVSSNQTASTATFLSFCNFGDGVNYSTLEQRSGAWSLVNRSGGFSNASAGTVTANRWTHVFGVWQTDTLKTLYVDGIAVSTLTTSSAIPSGISRFVIGKLRDDTTDVFGGLLDSIVFFAKSVSPPEVATLAKYRGIEHETYDVPIVRGFTSGGGIVGSASITEASDTVSAAGTIAIAATVAITEASDTVTSATTLALKATAAITEASDAVSSASALAVKATFAVTEADDSLSSTATIASSSVTGSASIIEASDTLSAAATLAIVGSLSVTEDSDTLTATSGNGQAVLVGNAVPMYSTIPSIFSTVEAY